MSDVANGTPNRYGSMRHKTALLSDDAFIPPSCDIGWLTVWFLPLLWPLAGLHGACACCLPGGNCFLRAQVSIMRITSKASPLSFCCMRIATDPPVGAIPPWLPTLPANVAITLNRDGPGGGEWFYRPRAAENGCTSRWRNTASINRCCAQKRHQGGVPLSLSGAGKLILYFHGGGMCLCTHQTHRAIAMELVDRTGATLLAIDYRRAPEHPHPAAVSDCLEVYKWLLDQGAKVAHGDEADLHEPQQIIFAGDSAGGGLVLATTGAALAAGLPPPAGGIMLSPWLDLTDFSSPSMTSNAAHDYLRVDIAQMFADAFVGLSSAGGATRHSVSPCNSVDLATQGRAMPPLHIEVGANEILRDQIVQWATKASAAGVDVSLYEAPDMVHVFMLFADFVADDAEPRMAFARCAEFCEKIYSNGTP